MTSLIQKKEELIDKTKTITGVDENKQLLRVIIKNKIPFTENRNGCFIDLTNVPEKVINEMMEVIKLCEENIQYNEKYKKELNKARQNVDMLYEKKLQKINKKREKKKKENKNDSVLCSNPFQEDEDFDQQEYENIKSENEDSDDLESE